MVFCYVLHTYNVRAIPAYRVYQLYDNRIQQALFQNTYCMHACMPHDRVLSIIKWYTDVMSGTQVSPAKEVLFIYWGVIHGHTSSYFPAAFNSYMYTTGLRTCR